MGSKRHVWKVGKISYPSILKNWELVQPFWRNLSFTIKVRVQKETLFFRLSYPIAQVMYTFIYILLKQTYSPFNSALIKTKLIVLA
jgi:hypothetical protein